MKRSLSFVFVLLTSFVTFSQDTITGYTFPGSAGGDSLNANLGLVSNQDYKILFGGTDTTFNTVYLTNVQMRFDAGM